MSQTIDERVVEMRFENASFEKNISQSISSLDKLESSLKLDGATSGLEKLGDAAKSVDFSPIGNALESVKSGFSALEVMAVGALARIGSKALDVAGNLANMLTSMSALNPQNIQAGWEKFGDKTTSVATLVSQGYDLGTVNAQLERLNWFTDETSYNFVDMVSNIAKFTASGKELQSSVTALEGIANWAALSGQNAATASRAMYQLSQAMGAGVMRKEDYKSIQNVSMDTMEFRQNALDAAIALGTLKKNADGTYQSLVKNTESFKISQFAEHLTQDAWFTSDVMMEVYNKYSSAVDRIYDYAERRGIAASEAIRELDEQITEMDDPDWAFGVKAFKAAQEARTWGDVVDSVKDAVSSGWTKTFELIIGDYEEAKSLYTQLAEDFWNIFAGGAEGRNDLLFSGLSSGWKQFLSEGISYEKAFKDRVIDTARDYGIAVDDIIEESGSFNESLKEGWLTSDILTKSVSDLADKLRNMDIDELTSKQIGYTEYQREKVLELDEALKNGTLSAEEFAESFTRISGRENLVQSLYNIRDALFAIDEESESAIGIIAVLKEAFAEIFPSMTGDQLYSITEKIKNFTQSLIPTAEKAEQLKNTFKGVFAVFDIGKQAISAIIGGIKTLLGFLPGMGDGLLGVTSSFGEYLVGLDETLKKNETFKKGVEAVVDFLIGIPDKLNSAFTSITGMSIGEAFEKLSERIQNAWIAMQPAVSSVISFLKNIPEHLSTAYQTIEPVLSVIWSFLKEIPGAISDFFQNLTGMTFSEAFMDIVGKISTALGKIRDFILEFKDVDTSGVETFGEKMHKYLEPVQKLFDGFKSALQGVWKFVQKLGPVFSEAVEWLGSFLSGLGEKIEGFVGHMDLKGVVDLFKDLVKAFLGLEAIKLVKQVTEVLEPLKDVLEQYSKNIKAKSILQIAEALLMLVGALVVLTLVDESKLQSAIAVISALFAELMLSMSIASKLDGNKGVNNMKKIAGAMVSLSAAVLILSLAAKAMAGLSWDELAKGLTGAIGLLLAVTASAAILAKSGGQVTKGAAGVIMLAIAVRILVGAVKKLGELDTDTLIQGLLSVITLCGTLAGAFALSGLTGANFGTGAGLLLLAASVLVLYHAVKKFSQMDTDDLIKGIGSVGAVLLELAGFVLIVNVVSKTFPSALLGLLELTALIAVAGAAIYGFGYLTEVIPNAKERIEEGGELLQAIGTAIGQFVGGMVGGFAEGVTSQLPQIGADLSAFMENVQGFIDGAAQIEEGTFDGLSEMIGAMALLTGAEFLDSLVSSFDQLRNLIFGDNGNETPHLVQMGEQLSEFMEAVSGFATGAAEIKADSFDSIPALVNAMKSLSGAEFVDNLAKIFGSKNSNLATLGQELSDFGSSLATFSGDIESVDLDKVMSSIDAMKQVINVATQISNSGLKNGQLSGFANTQGLVDFGKTLKDYYNAIDGIEDINRIQQSASAAAAMVSVANSIDGQTGFGKWLTGDDSLSAFGAEMVKFAGYLADFADATKDIVLGQIMVATQAANEVIGVANSIDGQSFLGKILTGDNSMSKFGSEMAKFGGSLKLYSEAVSGINLGDVDVSAAAANLIIGFAKTIPNEGGFLSWIVGDNVLDEFGRQMATFGRYLKRYSEVVAGINLGDVDVSAAAAKMIIDFAKAIPNEGGWLADIIGDNTLGKFGPQMAMFGSYLKNFSDNVAGISLDNVTTATQAANKIIDFAKIIPVQQAGQASSIAVLAADLYQLGPALASFSESLSDFDFDADKLSGFSDSMQQLGSSGIMKFVSGLNSQSGSAVMAISSILTQCLSTIRSHQNDFQSAGEACMTKLVAGLKTNVSGITSAISGALGDCLTSIRNMYSDFYSVGSYVASGLAEGIRAGASDVASASTEVANKAEEAARKALEERSPSRKMYKVGAFAAQGFVNALEDYTGKSYEAGYKAALEAGNGVKDAIEELADGKNLVETLIDGKMISNALIDGKTISDALIDGKTISDALIDGKRVTDALVDGKTISDALIGANKEIVSRALVDGKEIINTLIDGKTISNSGVDKNREINDKIREEYDDRREVISEESEKLVEEIEETTHDQSEAIKTTGTEQTTDAMTEVLDGCVSSVEERLPEFQEAGKNVVEGFAAGILENINLATDAASQMVDAVVETTKTELDEHSPSRVLYYIGDYAGRGFINGLDNSKENAYKAGENVAKYAKDGLTAAIVNIADFIDEGIDTEPTIRPVLDLSDLRMKSQSIDAMFSKRYASQISAGFRREDLPVEENTEAKPRSGNTYSFVQNLYSPKALSRIEIYRQTRNQFSAMKGLVEA